MKTAQPLLLAAVAAATLALGACATTGPGAGGGASLAAAQAAVADASRPEADRARDANRKPAEVVAFAGIQAGDKVAELLPGGGYFTRVFSKVVGPSGVVYALPPARPANAPAGAPDPSAAVTAISTSPGYGNIRVAPLPPTGPLAPEPVDVVWTSLNYHDLHNRPNADLMAVNKQVLDSLKPGGTYLVIDHSAAPGAGKSTTSTLHRIESDYVKNEVVAAGFEFVGSSPVLANPADVRTNGIREAEIRGHTDQFVLKFRKKR
jgi:predicted methyltransferase